MYSNLSIPPPTPPVNWVNEAILIRVCATPKSTVFITTQVVNHVKNFYGDAFLTAHFEVPGEMFGLAMEARKRGMGVVGSTKNILDFITEKVRPVNMSPRSISKAKSTRCMATP